MLTLSIIIPTYKSSVIEELIYEILDATKNKYKIEILIVDDEGNFSNWNLFEKICSKNTNVKYIELSKNFGQHNAIMAGINFAKYEFIVTIDDDLQNPPGEIEKIVSHLINNDFDLVYGSPNKSKHSIPRRIMSKGIRLILTKILRVKNVGKISSFRILRRDLLSKMSINSSEVSVDALLSWATSNIGFIGVEHNPRVNSKSNYSNKKLINFAITSIINFSTMPLKIATSAGIFTFGVGAVVLIVILGKYFVFGINVPGFTTLASLIILLSGTQLIILGILGEYLSKMHINIMNKPIFKVRRTIGID